jgi:hypothetical protein
MPAASHLTVALLAALAVVAVAASPAVAALVPVTSDPFTDLGGGSPVCHSDVGPTGQANCRATGSVEHRQPLDAFGLDVQVPFSISHLSNTFLGALQSVAGLLWMGLVYLIKGVLLLLEWAFSIDLLDTAMSAIQRTLSTLHDRVIGQPWFLAALSVTALWGIWRGLVQRQAIQTITGLLATVGLMVCGLVILAQPAQTVGHASHLANDAALGFLSAATSQPLDAPARSLADATQNIFASTIRDPWCALEFGSVTYCDAHARGSATLTNADVWLGYPAGSGERTALYHLLKGENPNPGRGLIGTLTHPILGAVGLGGSSPTKLPDNVKALVAPDKPRVHLQEAGGTFSRFAILGLIAIGMLGAAALLAYLGIRLLLASIMALLLLLFAPAVLLAPAFGEAGRATFVAWAKRLAGALAAKLIYALFLAVVLAAATTLRRLNIGWFATWLLQIALWWGVLIKRHELIGFASARHDNSHPHRGLASSMAQGYYALQMGRSVKSATERIWRAPSRANHAIADHRAAARAQRAELTASSAIEEFDGHGHRYLEAEQQRAQALLGGRGQAQRELRVVDRRLIGFDEQHAGAKAAGRPAPVPTGDQAALLAHRRRLLEQLHAPELRQAQQTVAHAERNRAQTGEPITAGDLAAYRQRRATDLAANLPLEHERHVRAAGLDPAELATAGPEQRTAMLSQVARHLDRERELLATIPANPANGRPELRIDPADFRARLAQQRARARSARVGNRSGGPR